MRCGMPRLSRHCEVPEFKHACLGGVYALKGAAALRRRTTRATSSRSWSAPTSPSTSAAAAASRRRARAPSRCWSTREAEAVRGRPRALGQRLGLPRPRLPQAVRAPLPRGATRRARKRMSDFPVFSGKYSTYSYLDETVHAVEDMLRKLNVSAGKYYNSVHSLFFHRPYEMMPVQAMSFLYVRGMARGDHYQRRAARAVPGGAASRSKTSMREALSTPDLYARVSAEGPRGRRSVRGDQRGRGRAAQEARVPRAARGEDEPRRGGGARPRQPVLRRAAGVACRRLRGGRRAGARSRRRARWWRSATAAATPRKRCRSRRCPASSRPRRASASSRRSRAAIDLSREQYEALHDGREVPGLDYAPQREFVISARRRALRPALPGSRRRVLPVRRLSGLRAAPHVRRRAFTARETSARGSR